MRTFSKLLIAPVLLLGAACGRDDQAPAPDDALKNDLALAAAAQPYQPQQFVSPTEQGYAGQYAPQYGQPYYAQPVYSPQPYYGSAPAPAPVYRAPARTSTASRAST